MRAGAALVAVTLLGMPAHAELPYNYGRPVVRCPPVTKPATVIRPTDAIPRTIVAPPAMPRKAETKVETKPTTLTPARDSSLPMFLIALLASIGLFALVAGTPALLRAFDRILQPRSNTPEGEFVPVEPLSNAEEFRLQAAALRALKRDLDEQLRAARAALDEYRRAAPPQP